MEPSTEEENLLQQEAALQAELLAWTNLGKEIDAILAEEEANV